MLRESLLVALLLALCAMAPQPPEMSAAAKAAVAAWKAKFQEGLDFAAAHPPASFADELNQRVGVEQTGREALGLISAANLPADQMQLAMNAVWAELGARDADNTAWLKQHVPADGWFRISRDGAQTASNAWLIVQHSPDKEWQQEVLKLMAPLVAEKEVSGPDFALLYDRVEMFAGRPQRYGSQGACRDGAIVMHDLEDPARIDELRASVGLGSYDEYKARLGVGRPC